MKIGYIRVSTAEQNTIRQEELMQELGVDEVFVDRMSGKNTNRPELLRLLEYVRQGDTVIVEAISRFARNRWDLLELVERLTAKGVEFVSKKESIDTSTPTGKFMLTVFKVIILGTQLDSLNDAKADWEKQKLDWEKYLLSAFKDNKRLVQDNVFGVSSRIFDFVAGLENGRTLTPSELSSVADYARDYGITLNGKAEAADKEAYLEEKITLEELNARVNLNGIRSALPEIRSVTNLDRLVNLLQDGVLKDASASLEEDVAVRFKRIQTELLSKLADIKAETEEKVKLLTADAGERRAAIKVKSEQAERVEHVKTDLDKTVKDLKSVISKSLSQMEKDMNGKLSELLGVH